MMTKKRVIKDYEKLTQDLKNLLNETYPGGIAEFVKPYTDVQGKLFYAVPLETDDDYFLIRLPFKMVNIKEEEEEVKSRSEEEDVFEELTLEDLDEDEYIIQDEE